MSVGIEMTMWHASTEMWRRDYSKSMTEPRSCMGWKINGRRGLPNGEHVVFMTRSRHGDVALVGRTVVGRWSFRTKHGEAYMSGGR